MGVFPPGSPVSTNRRAVSGSPRGSCIHSPLMARARSIDYRRARSVALLTGMIVIASVALTMLAREVDRIEVVATVSFAPIFVAMLLFGWRAGAGLGLAAGGLYLALRLPAVRLVGWSPLLGLILSRTAGFVAFGAIGGWAATELGAAIGKLELYDVVDDDTRLGNARSFLRAVDRETARVARHSTVFSVSYLEFALPESRRGRTRLLRAVGRALTGALRTADDICHLPGPGRTTIVAVLPDTGPEGAATVAVSLSARLREVAADARTGHATIPGDDGEIAALVERARAIEAASRP